MSFFIALILSGTCIGIILERSHLLSRDSNSSDCIKGFIAFSLTSIVLVIGLSLLGLTIQVPYLLPYALLISAVLVALGFFILRKAGSGETLIQKALYFIALYVGMKFGVLFFFYLYPDLPPYLFTHYTLHRPTFSSVAGTPFWLASLVVIAVGIFIIRRLKD